MQTNAPTPKRWRWIAAAVLAVAVALMAVVFLVNRGEPNTPGVWNAATRKKLDEVHLAAQQYISSEKIPQAKLILEKLLKDYPEDAVGEVLMAKVLMAENHAQAAYEHIIRSLELDGARPEIQFLAGMLAQKIGKPDLAKYHYSRASDLDKASGRYPMYLGQILLSQNDLDGAEIELSLAGIKDHTLSEVPSMLAEIYARRGKIDIALDKINTALHQVQPDDPKYLAYTLQKAQLLRRANQPDDALRTLMALSPKQQQQPGTVEQIAQCHLMMSKPARAAAVWAELFAIDAANQNAATEAGLCFVRANDIEHAKQYYEYARALGTENPKVQSLQAAIKSAGKTKSK